MLTLKTKELINIHKLAILLVGILLVLEVFYIGKSISFRFESSMLTLNSLLLTSNVDK